MTQKRFDSGEPGLYPSVHPLDYHAFDACSNSRLFNLKQSAAHCAHAIAQPWDETPDQTTGSIYHLAVLEPERFDRAVIVASSCAGKTKQGKSCNYSPSMIVNGLPYCRRNGHAPDAPNELDERTWLINDNQLETVLAMRRATFQHPAASQLLTGVENELSGIFFFDTLRCKMRIDHLNESIGAIVDLKKTRDASPAGFARSVAKFGYHMQGAMYIDGLKTLGIRMDNYVIIAQEDQPPFLTGVYALTAEALDAGRDEIDPLLTTYAECKRTGLWPGYSSRVEDLDLPRYAYSAIYD